MLCAAVLLLAASVVSFVVPRGRCSPRSEGARTAAAATITTKSAREVKGGSKKKSQKYRGPVNPRLRSMLQATEYRQLVEVLNRLEDEGMLDNFLQRADEYWASANLLELADLERSGGIRQVMNKFKTDWGRIWPEEMDSDRLRAFEVFSSFWSRLERGKLVGDVMKDVLPDAEKAYSDKLDSKDQQKLMAMTDDERRDEIMNRMGESEIIAQFAILSKEDREVKKISAKMVPFIARFISTLERKVSQQTESLGKTADLVAAGAAVVALLVILSATGVIKLPDPTW